MKTPLLIILFAACLLAGVHVQAQSVDKLSEKNGFKTLVLGSDITAIKSKLEYLSSDHSLDRDSCYYQDYKDTALYSIGDIKLTGVTLRIFKNKILSIIITFDKKNGPDLMAVYLKAFGLYSERPNRFMDKYYWYSPNVKLFLNYDLTSKLPMAMYTSVPLNDEVERNSRDKTKKAVSDL